MDIRILKYSFFSIAEFGFKEKEFKHLIENTKKEKVEKVLQIINNYEKEKKISENDVNFINEVIALDFLLRQNWDETKSLNGLKIDFIKVLLKITYLDRETVKPILKYMVHLLNKINYKSKLVNIKIN
ncbi:hypothetical protein [Chryseobacterium sp. RR2-3-20]|uniref:hypothetical protein n=1 Tax=Chryseobacterium sp. RR2-3-20 TaxID=2787626 RepID=UPI001ADF51B2|nr:hypothetical protein [Chryseobacterium sp. RR2-3-20]